jgi:hypothetical protein
MVFLGQILAVLEAWGWAHARGSDDSVHWECSRSWRRRVLPHFTKCGRSMGCFV